MAKTISKTKTKSIIRKGPASGKKSNDFIVVKEDEPATIVPILPTGEINSIDLHAFWAINPAVTFACIKGSDDAGDGCPGCLLGDKAGYRAFLPVLDAEGELKVFPFGISVERQLVTLEDELGTIVGTKLRVKRTGNGLATKYQVINLGKEVKIDVDEDDAAKFVEAHIEIKDRDKIVDELTAAGLMGKKKKSKLAEEEDEDEDNDEEEEDDDDEEVTPVKSKKAKVVEEEDDDEDDDEDEEDETPVKKSVKKVPAKKVPVKKAAPVAKKPVKKSKKSDDWE